MNRIPLAERLHLLDEGVDKQEQNIAIVREMAETPITTYLAAFEDEMYRLMRIILMSPQQAKFQTVSSIAQWVERAELDWDEKNEVVKILALPFQRYCEERIKKNGKIAT